MNGIALVCANFGAIDTLKPLPPHDGIDAFCYTDEPTRDRTPAADRATWTRIIVPDYPRHDFDARLRSRYFKHQIHRLDEARDHRWLVWIDASLRMRDLTFLHAWALRLALLPAENRCLVVPHPERQTVYQEYQYISDEIARGNEYMRVRYAQEKMAEQMRHFEERGWDLASPLYCGGFWMVENSELMARVWDDWWHQNLRFGMMDQLSLSPMLTLRGCRPQTLDVKIWKNDFFEYVDHPRR